MSSTAVPTLNPMPIAGLAEGHDGVDGEDGVEDEAEVEEVAVDVLQEEREAGLAACRSRGRRTTAQAGGASQKDR